MRAAQSAPAFDQRPIEARYDNYAASASPTDTSANENMRAAGGDRMRHVQSTPPTARSRKESASRSAR